MYDYDVDAILLHPLETKQDEEIATAYRHDYEVQVHILDNECIEEMRRAFKNAKIQFELVPYHIHRQIAAEREPLET